jgi:paraquat-inducible protein A
VGPRHPRSLAAAATGADRFLGALVLWAALLLVLGWTLPIMTVERLLFFSDSFSIIEGALALWAEGHLGLFLVVFVFSVLFPALKLLLALYLWYLADAQSAALRRSLAWMGALGRWSMLDVFVVALAVVAIQASWIDEVITHPGIYVFGAAIILSMLAVQRMTAVARRATSGDGG